MGQHRNFRFIIAEWNLFLFVFSLGIVGGGHSSGGGIGYGKLFLL
jgi:hypothetical protein